MQPSRKNSWNCRNHGLIVTVVLLITVLVAEMGFGAPGQQSGAPPASVGDQSTVKALYREKCSACHDLPNPEEKAYSREKWRATVDRMLTKYKASELIAPKEAAQIVDYLASIKIPSDTVPRGPGAAGASDPMEVWTAEPAQTHVFTFSGPDALEGLTPSVSGVAGPDASWKAAEAPGTPDGNVVRVRSAGANPDRFSLLTAPRYTGHDMDTRVSLHIAYGKVSPAAGIVIGYRDASNYDVVRYNGKSNDVALIQIRGTVHTTLQKASAPTAANGKSLDWHMLRIQARRGHIRAWLDLNRLISIDEPDYTGGAAGLWSQGDAVVDFDDFAVDIYDPQISGGK